MKIDLRKAQIDPIEIEGRKKIQKWNVMSETVAQKKTETNWNYERKRVHGQKMREAFKIRKTAQTESEKQSESE